MANESLYTGISDLLPLIWEGALNYMRFNFVMPRLVTLFNDRTSMVPRKVSLYEETAVTDNLAEDADLAPTEFDRDLLTTLTPKEIGAQHIISDRRIASDDMNVMVDAASNLGYVLGKKVEQDLLTSIDDFTTTLGNGAAALTKEDIFNGRAVLEAAGVRGPYIAVLHPYHYLDIFDAFTDLSAPAPLDIRNQAQANYYITKMADITVVVSGLISNAGNAAKSGLFTRDALAFDVRRGLRIEPERDASHRWWELNATMIYAADSWRADHGVTLHYDATAPA